MSLMYIEGGHEPCLDARAWYLERLLVNDIKYPKMKVWLLEVSLARSRRVAYVSRDF